MNARPGILILALFAILPAHAEPDPQPDATKSRYFQTVGAGFSGEIDVPGMYYALTLDIRRKIRKPMRVEVLFQDPGNPEEPLQVAAELQPGQEVLVLQSPPIFQAENGKNYSVTLLLFEDSSEEEPVSEHVQLVQFMLDPAIAARMDVEVK